MIFVLSLRFVRRFSFELFQKAHLLLALVTVVALICHILPGNFIKVLFPSIALIVWGMNTLGQLFRMYIGGGVKRTEITQIYYPPKTSLSDSRVSATRLSLELERPIPIGPGQYGYLRFFKKRLRDNFQSHPFLIAWWDEEEREGGSATTQILTFLILPQGGLSARLAKEMSLQDIIFEGPYGQDLQLGRYQTVILVADGIGIIGVLPYAQYLSERKNRDQEIKREVRESRIALKEERERYQRLKDLLRNRIETEEGTCTGKVEDIGKKNLESAEKLRRDLWLTFQNVQNIRRKLRELWERRLHRDWTKKVDLFWELKDNYDERWIDDRLKKLQDNDFKRVGSLHVWKKKRFLSRYLAASTLVYLPRREEFRPLIRSLQRLGMFISRHNWKIY